MWRRAFAKRNEEKVMQFYELIGSHVKRDEIMEDPKTVKWVWYM